MALSPLMVAGSLILTFGICLMLFGLWAASQGVRKNGLLPRGSRQVQFCGMGLAVGGIGISMWSFGLLVADVLGAILVIQAVLMIAFSGRIEKVLR